MLKEQYRDWSSHSINKLSAHHSSALDMCASVDSPFLLPSPTPSSLKSTIAANIIIGGPKTFWEDQRHPQLAPAAFVDRVRRYPNWNTFVSDASQPLAKLTTATLWSPRRSSLSMPCTYLPPFARRPPPRRGCCQTSPTCALGAQSAPPQFCGSFGSTCPSATGPPPWPGRSNLKSGRRPCRPRPYLKPSSSFNASTGIISLNSPNISHLPWWRSPEWGSWLSSWKNRDE